MAWPYWIWISGPSWGSSCNGGFWRCHHSFRKHPQLTRVTCPFYRKVSLSSDMMIVIFKVREKNPKLVALRHRIFNILKCTWKFATCRDGTASKVSKGWKSASKQPSVFSGFKAQAVRQSNHPCSGGKLNRATLGLFDSKSPTLSALSLTLTLICSTVYKIVKLAVALSIATIPRKQAR